MKILVVNCGSSSCKSALFSTHSFTLPKKPDWSDKIEWGLHNTSLKSLPDALKKLFLPINDQQIDIVVHRIVHGGEDFSQPVILNRSNLKKIRTLSELAPLHNPSNIKGIEVCEKLFPESSQAAVFDTAFHHTMPEEIYTYAGPYEWRRWGIRKYGFHGPSYAYCTGRLKEIAKSKLQNVVICHLGNGASLAAIKNGKSVNTTMGFTPLEGLMMGTRSGSVDPGILFFLSRTKAFTSHELDHILNYKSGLLGIGRSSDMRDIEKKARTDHRAQLALNMYVQRIVSGIGSMTATLGGLDALVFTAGIGENSEYVRKNVCKQLAFLGIEIDVRKNKNSKSDHIISTNRSEVQVVVIHTQEEWMMAKEILKICNK
jgi:acetate kinase